MSRHKLGDTKYFAESWNKRCYWCDEYYYDDDEECEVTNGQRTQVALFSTAIIVGVIILILIAFGISL
jgi:hypothetical protein